MNSTSDTSEITSSATFLSGGGEMARRIREFNWSQSPFGLPEHWPQSLRSALSISLGCGFPIAIYWGRELALLYNDAWSPIPGDKHPWALGRPAREVWPEIWEEIEPLFAQVLATGEPVRLIDRLLPMRRRGFTEECYFDFTFSPILDEAGSVGGIFNAAVETTSRVLAERRARLLRDLAEGTVDAPTLDVVAMRAVGAFAGDVHDLPFTLLYLAETDGWVRLAASSGLLEDAIPRIPTRLNPNDPAGPWPFNWAGQFADRDGVMLENNALVQFGGSLCGGPWPEQPRAAVIHALKRADGGEPAGFFIAGLSPRLAVDDEYRGFIAQAAGAIAAALQRAQSYAAERERAEKLAEIDRAKTAFFSNVSHEFRTPLTLLLAPLEEILNKPSDEVLDDNRKLIALAHRNGNRLLKLVNSLLDFSRIEAGRAKANFEPVDLAVYTAELASSFRSAMEKAGLSFVVDCPPLSEPVHLDREMWEKIVLNLLSNAFKFTLSGEVRVTVRASTDVVEMAVRDTGTGIPREGQAHLFERFYRVQGAQGRTHEGSGIGLALVHELVKLHGGTVSVESESGSGSTFTVTVPRGVAHLPTGQYTAPAKAMNGSAATAYVAEALRWLPTEGAPPSEEFALEDALPAMSIARPRVLLADDNADMREYITRLLSPHCEVTAVADGTAALDAALVERPDLVLSDVMMPRLDGFGLMRAMRADTALQSVPIILLSARAGEEARVDGLEAGADDYLTKPFQTRELVAKVNSTLTLARVRAEALVRETQLREERTEILESMNLAFMALDEDFRIVYLNAEAARMHDMTPEKYLGRIHWEAFPAANGTALETNYRRVMAERVPVRFEHFYTPWQQWFEINAYPMSHGWVGIFFRDVTDRKLANAALQERAEQIRLIADTAPVLIAHCDSEHRYKFVNEPYAARFDLTREQVVGRHIAEVIGQNAYESIRAYLERTLAGEMVEFEVSIPYEKLGAQFMRCAYAPERNLRGEVVGLVAVIMDITERRQMEMQLREAKDAAEMANQSKDRFLAVLSHELRTPLTPVLMAVGALEHDPELRPDVREDLAMMKRNIELETKLIDDLLDLNRITSGKLQLALEAVELNETVQQVCEICRSQLNERGIRLEMHLGETPYLISADAARLQQVLWNILKNAIKFTPEQGTIRVFTQRLGSGRCEVRVEDTGMGIPSELVPRIFDAFEQGSTSVTRQFGGLGLGLAISKALVDLHHGTIRAESAGPGQGSTFIIELPGETPGVPAKSPASAPTQDEQSLQLRLLLVEDHLDTARTLARLLRRAGYAVVIATDIASAIATVAREPFDLLISDLGLPDGTGYDIMRAVRAKHHVPGIAMSGYGMEDDVSRSHEAGFIEHLVKPIGVSQLIAAIRRVTENRG